MLNNSIGRLIWYKRTRAGISAEALCRGICSRTFLHRLESGERRCEKIMSDALLQRAGVSADKFIYIMNPDEQDWMLLRERLVQAVNQGNRALILPLLEEYRRLTEKKCGLHRQFFYLCEVASEWNNRMDTAQMLDQLTQAWKITMGDIPMEEMADCRLSLTECNIQIMYCRIQEDRGEKEQAINGYGRLLEYLETKMDAQDRAKPYAQAAYRLTNCYLEQGEFQKAAETAAKAVMVLKAQGRLFYMEKFLRIVLRYGNVSKEEQAIFREACDALEGLYTSFGAEEEERVRNLYFGESEAELCGDFIRARRKALGVSQEELAEGICDTVTISRIERGKVAPKTHILQKVMERIGMKEGCFEAVNQIGQPELCELADKISVLLSLSDGKEAEVLIAELECRIRKAEGMDKFAWQYIENVKTLALLMQGKITSREHYDRQRAALHLTVPIDKKRQKEWRFSRQEVNMANALVYSCGETGKTEEVLELLYDIKNQYENKPFETRRYAAGYELTIRNIGNLLGNLGEHAKAVETAKEGILLGLRTGRGTAAAVLLYDCGRNMERLQNTKSPGNAKRTENEDTSGNIKQLENAKQGGEESCHYIKASMALNLLFYGKEKCTE